jgi:tRNA(Ile)-lysidine synthase TilS/MesJ
LRLLVSDILTSSVPAVYPLSLSFPVETMVYRLGRGSSVDGLAGMYKLHRLVLFPEVQIMRPLLQCRKQQLQQVCHEAGLEWIEDSSNASTQFARNYIRHLLGQDPELTRGLHHMFTSLNQTRKAMTTAGIPQADVPKQGGHRGL